MYPIPKGGCPIKIYHATGSTTNLYEAIDISASGPQTEEHKKHREEVMHYFINRANTAKNLWTTCDTIFKTKTNRTKSDQGLSNGKSQKEKEKERRRLKD